MIKKSLRSAYLGTAILMTPVMVFLVSSPSVIISLLFSPRFVTDSTVLLVQIMILSLFTATLRHLITPHVIASLRTRISLEATAMTSLLTLFVSFSYGN